MTTTLSNRLKNLLEGAIGLPEETNELINAVQTGANSVSNVNGITGAVTLAAGSNITITPVDHTITISSTGGGGGVSNVTASGPLSSSGGANPDISLTGVVSVSNGGTGESSYTAGSVIFSDGTNLAEDNTNFFWNNTTKELRVGPDPTIGSKQNILSVQELTDPTNDINAPNISVVDVHYTDDSSKAVFSSWDIQRPIVDAGKSAVGGVIGHASLLSRLDASDTGNVDIGAGYYAQLISGNAAHLMGLYAGVAIGNHSIDNLGTITNMYDYWSIPSNIGAGVVTNRYGIYIEPDANYTKKNWLSGNSLLGGTSFSIPNATLQVAGDINQSITKTDSGTAGVITAAITHTTVDGSNTTIGNQTVATGTVAVGATNDKVVGGAVNTVTRGDGTDDGTLDAVAGTTNLTFVNSGAAGVTNKYFGSANTLFLQQGTITTAYDFYSETVPAGSGTVTNHYGVYIKPDPTVAMQSWISGSTLLGGTSFVAPAHALDVQGDAQVQGVFYSFTNSQPSLDSNNRNLLDGGGIESVDWANRVLVNSSITTILDFSGSQALFPSDLATSFIYDLTNKQAFDVTNRLGISSDGTSIYLDGINRFLVRGGGTNSVDWENSQLLDPASNVKASWNSTSDPISLSGVLIQDNHVISRQASAPTVAAAASAGTGASASLDAHATDFKGIVTVTTGTVGLSTGAYAVVTFDQPFTVAPTCVVSANTANASLISPYWTSTTTTLTINFAVAAGISATLKVAYVCIQ